MQRICAPTGPHSPEVLHPPRLRSATPERGCGCGCEAIRFLERQKPLPPSRSDGLAEAARELNGRQAKSGFIGHGSGGSALQPRWNATAVQKDHRETSAMARRGPGRGMQLIIDDGVPTGGTDNISPDLAWPASPAVPIRSGRLLRYRVRWRLPANRSCHTTTIAIHRRTLHFT